MLIHYISKILMLYLASYIIFFALVSYTKTFCDSTRLGYTIHIPYFSVSSPMGPGSKALVHGVFGGMISREFRLHRGLTTGRAKNSPDWENLGKLG